MRNCQPQEAGFLAENQIIAVAAPQCKARGFVHTCMHVVGTACTACSEHCNILQRGGGKEWIALTNLVGSVRAGV
jgi:hypothetical protein